MVDRNELRAQRHPKRLKRATKSCAECRRRKVKCSLASEDASTCAECLKRNFRCIPISSDWDDSNFDSDTPTGDDDRMGRIEKFLSRICDMQKDLPTHVASALARREPAATQLYTPHSTATSLQKSRSPSGLDRETRSPSQFSQSRTTTHDFLASLLPSQHDEAVIAANTNAWALYLTPTQGAMPKPRMRTSPFTQSVVSDTPLTTLGQTLLYIALSIQQLPPDFDAALLEVPDIESNLRSYIFHVKSLILADEELTCSPEGVACLHLLGMIYINEGALKKAWMTFRRSIDVVRLLGYDKSYAAHARNANDIESIAKRRIWHGSVIADAYVSLLLGLKPAAGKEPFGPDDTWVDPWTDDDSNFQRLLSGVAIRLARVNCRSEGPVDEVINELLQSLHALASSMPASWWNTSIPTNDRSPEAAHYFSRLLMQTWFFQIRLFLYLPHAFRAIHESRFEHARQRSLETSRAILSNYLAFRGVNNTQLQCRCVDFAAFTAAVTIVMHSIQDPGHHPIANQNASSITMVHQVMQSMKLLAKHSSREAVAKQSVKVLNRLLEYSGAEPKTKRNLEVNVPYFGTVKIITSDAQRIDIQFSQAKFSIPSEPQQHAEQQPISELETCLFDSVYGDDLLNWDGGL